MSARGDEARVVEIALAWLPADGRKRCADAGDTPGSAIMPVGMGEAVIAGFAEPLFHPLGWRLTKAGRALLAAQDPGQRSNEGEGAK